jgi:hypothetical protein
MGLPHMCLVRNTVQKSDAEHFDCPISGYQREWAGDSAVRGALAWRPRSRQPVTRLPLFTGKHALVSARQLGSRNCKQNVFENMRLYEFFCYVQVASEEIYLGNVTE